MKFSLSYMALLCCSAFSGEIASAYDVGNETNDPTGRSDHSNGKGPVTSHERNLRGNRMTNNQKKKKKENPREPHGGGDPPGNNCGIDWVDADKCQTPCPNGLDSECPSGETCFADITCSYVLPPAPTPTDPAPVTTAPAPPAPTNPNPTLPATGGGDESRLIAYVGNWQACPTEAQYSQYTHIVIAFAVSYQYNEPQNTCSTTCDISTPPVCNNAANPELIQQWKAAGIKVILSFGGAGMGGSWDGDVNNCWDYCFGRETQVVNRLTEIVNDMGLDGVDIDYEYFYENNQRNAAQRGFNMGSQAQTFLREVTVGLRNSLPAGSIVTHAPMDADAVPGTAYYDLLVDISSSLDFLMPQYYNGYIRPVTDFAGALSHFSTLSNDMFGGDPNKVVFGFCINQCGSFNIDGAQAASVMNNLSEAYPCNGGAFFWVAENDANGSWSLPVSTALQTSTGSCAAGNTSVPPPASSPQESIVLR
jgi:hypothetical protein